MGFSSLKWRCSGSPSETWGKALFLEEIKASERRRHGGRFGRNFPFKVPFSARLKFRRVNKKELGSLDVGVNVSGSLSSG